MKILSVIGIALFGVLSLTATASAGCAGNTNPVLVKNDGFESGTIQAGANIPNWTVFDTMDPEVLVATFAHKSGAQSLEMASVGGENRISQKLSTSAGSVYTVCFWLAPGSAPADAGGPNGQNSFRAQWNGQDMIALKNIGNSTTPSAFVLYQFFVVATGNDVLSFEERNDPSFFLLDDVYVQLCSSCALANGAMKANTKQPFPSFKH